MLYSLANLEIKELKMLRELEHAIGKNILAFSRHDVKFPYLTAVQLEKIKKLEEQLGLILIATE